MPYYGGKQRIASKIVATFPAHTHYIEPYAGGLSVLLAKPPSKIETINDLDGELVTFWRVLRDQPDELARVCALTPHARQELSICREPTDSLSDLEVARRVWSQLVQGRSGRRTRTGWRFYVDAQAVTTPDGRLLQRLPGPHRPRRRPAGRRAARVHARARPDRPLRTHPQQPALRRPALPRRDPPTILVTFFFGLFGIIPAAAANTATRCRPTPTTPNSPRPSPLPARKLCRRATPHRSTRASTATGTRP